MRRTITAGSRTIGDAEVLTSRLRQAKGLMFSRRRNLIFALPRERFLTMHMFFVFYPIDVVFLDSRREIVELKARFRPFTLYRLKNRARYIIELQSASIERHGLKIGDKIDF
jgi:uncharacterized protein